MTRTRAQYAGWTSGTRRRDAASRIVAPAGRASESRWWWAYKVQEQYKGGNGGEMISEEECLEDKWEGLGLGFGTGDGDGFRMLNIER
jgi:hypothetical protein